MSQTARKEIRRLCRSLLYIAALHLCPCVRRRRAGESAPFGHQQAHTPAVQTHTASSVINIFGKVISLPLGIKLPAGSSFEYRRDEAPDFGVLCRQRPSPSRIRTKNAESPRKTGLDLLRATLNLARGDLEQNAGPSCV